MVAARISRGLQIARFSAMENAASETGLRLNAVPETIALAMLSSCTSCVGLRKKNAPSQLNGGRSIRGLTYQRY